MQDPKGSVTPVSRIVDMTQMLYDAFNASNRLGPSETCVEDKALPVGSSLRPVGTPLPPINSKHRIKLGGSQ